MPAVIWTLAGPRLIPGDALSSPELFVVSPCWLRLSWSCVLRVFRLSTLVARGALTKLTAALCRFMILARSVNRFAYLPSLTLENISGPIRPVRLFFLLRSVRRLKTKSSPPHYMHAHLTLAYPPSDVRRDLHQLLIHAVRCSANSPADKAKMIRYRSSCIVAHETARDRLR